jgi:hypothetical protein
MNDDEIRKALEDIAELKKSVRGNLRRIRPVFLDKGFFPFSVVSAIVFPAFFCVLQYAIDAAGGFAAISEAHKAAFAGVFTILVIIAGVLKNRLITWSLARQTRRLTWYDLFVDRDFRKLYILTIFGIITVIGVGLYIGWRVSDWWILFPIMCLCYAFVIAQYGIAFCIDEFIPLAVLSFAFGISSLFLMHGHGLLWLAAYMFVLMAGYGAIVRFSKDYSKE